jgi:RNA polymerase sigma-70 factor (ECF subfamily)
VTVDRLAVARGSATPDETLVRRARSGDVAAFEALMASRIDRCYRLAWSILANDADAADATQDGFVSAWRQLPRLRDPASFDGWLNRIVANAARMSRRRRDRLHEVQIAPLRPAEPSPCQGEPPSDPNALNEIDEVAEREAIGRAFDRLRPDQRVLLVLHHVEARPLSEIALSLGIPVGTLKWRLHGARRALERAMEDEA